METVSERRFAWDEGKSEAELREEQNRKHPAKVLDDVAVKSKAEAAPLGFWKVTLAVMVGNLLTGIVCALIYAVMHS